MSRPAVPRVRPPPAVAVSTAAIGALVVLGAIGAAADREGYVGDRSLVLLIAVGYSTVGIWVWLRAVHTVGRRMVWVGLAAALNWAVQGWSGTLTGAWASQWSWIVPVLLVPLVLSRFPDGRPAPGRWALVETGLLALAVAIPTVLAVAAVGAPRTLLVGPSGSKPAWSASLIDGALLGLAAWSLAAVAQLAAVVLRARSSSGADRGQLRCLGAALLATLVGVLGLAVSDAPAFQVLAALALPLGLGAAVLRYALYDLDLLVHRVAVWVVLSAAVVAALFGASWWATRLLPTGWARTSQVLLLAALVLVLDPARRFVQRGVSRLLFGRRDAPEVALSMLGQELSTATDRHSAQDLCRSVAATLGLPWVGLRRGETSVVSWGRPTSAPLEVPLAAGPRPATLLLGPRRAGERFAAADQRVISAMATQVGVAVKALTLADDLQKAREHLVRSREEERKRLRDDLHDGVGPTIAGLRLQLAALTRSQPGPWRQLDEDLAACSAEVGRVIEGLRPPVLDGGLRHALHHEAARWRGGRVVVRVDTQALDGTAPLPAAVETAAYRIAAEAMCNAVRHATPQTITVDITIQTTGNGEMLTLRICDDGNGRTAPRLAGVGLGSMRDRAEELGGTLVITPSPGEGTVVQALLPLNGSPAVLDR